LCSGASRCCLGVRANFSSRELLCPQRVCGSVFLRWSEAVESLRSAVGTLNKGPRSRLRHRVWAAGGLPHPAVVAREGGYSMVCAGAPPSWPVVVAGGIRSSSCASSSSMGVGAVHGVPLTSSTSSWLPWRWQHVRVWNRWCVWIVFNKELFSSGYWWLVSAFTLDSLDEGHPLRSAFDASSRCSPYSTGPSGAVPGASVVAAWSSIRFLEEEKMRT
jgi:hypothetical protein